MNNESLKLYVDSSFNLALRISDHLNNRSSNILLQRAFTKYGLNNFSLYILDTLDKSSMESNLTNVDDTVESLNGLVL